MTITMYGADWCGDCRRAKEYFADHDIEFDYVNAEEVADAAELIVEFNNGVQRIPVIVFDDGTHLTEPTNQEIETKLADLADGNSYAVTRNDVLSRFELHGNGVLLSHATFSDDGTVVTVPHVATIPEHRGQGNAGRLMEGVLRHVRMTRSNIAPVCPFAASHIAENPQWQGLVAVAA